MSGVLSAIGSTGLQFWKLAFQISPIILQNGIASYIPGGLLPILALTESGAALSLISPFVGGSVPANLDDFFAQFSPTPGATLIEFDVAHYPFANLTIAANAVIMQPLRVGITMHVPVREAGGYVSKFTTFLALQAALQNHALLGGTYNVLTPTYLYTNCLLTTLTDASGGDSRQAQNAWQFEFEQHLVTQSAADQAQSYLMQNITNATPISGQPATSGPGLAPSPSNAPGVGYGASNLTGAGVAAYPGAGTAVPVTATPL